MILHTIYRNIGNSTTILHGYCYTVVITEPTRAPHQQKLGTNKMHQIRTWDRSGSRVVRSTLKNSRKAAICIKAKNQNLPRSPASPQNRRSRRILSSLASSPCCDLTGGRVEDIFRKLQNLWRRINAGYIISRQKPESLMKESFAWVPEEVDEPNRENMHLKDGFSEYAEALARASNMYPKEKREPIKFVSAKEKAILRAQKIQKMKDGELKADLKLGIKKEEPKKKEAKGK